LKGAVLQKGNEEWHGGSNLQRGEDFDRERIDSDLYFMHEEGGKKKKKMVWES